MNREQKTGRLARTRATALAPRTQAFIDGKYVPAASGATFDCINPATGKSIAQVASCDAADVGRARSRARARAFEARRTGRGARRAARKQVLLRFAELIRKHREELALIETLDMGKPISRLADDRHPGRGELHRLVRRGDRQGLRRGRADRRTSRSR